MNRDWRDQALCATRPHDWWETGDGGNRLAMTLCKLACPVLSDCGLYAHDETGVVRAGIAYGDSGRALPICDCGRPVIGQPATAGRCRVCWPAEPQPWGAKPVTRGGKVVDAVGDIRHLNAVGMSDPQIAAVLGCDRTSVRNVRHRFNIPSSGTRPGPKRQVAA